MLLIGPFIYVLCLIHTQVNDFSVEAGPTIVAPCLSCAPITIGSWKMLVCL